MNAFVLFNKRQVDAHVLHLFEIFFSSKMVKAKNLNKKLKKQKLTAAKVEEDVVELPAKRSSDEKIPLKVSFAVETQ